jgi:hypothetical protein
MASSVISQASSRRTIDPTISGSNVASGIILTRMTAAPTKSRRTKSQYRLAQTGIPDYANKSLDEQVARFSELVMENSKRPIYRVWSKVDPVAHAVIMSELGCFDGKVRAQHYEWARKDSAELNRHTRMLGTFLKKQAEHENIAARRPRFYMPRRYFAEPEGRGTLGKVLEIEMMHLKRSVAHINRVLKKRSKWDARGMVLAQEYVIRRADFLRLPGRVRLTPAAIADIYQLTQRTSQGGDDPDTVENIRKAIAYFRKNP